MRHHATAIVATAADYLVMVSCVELLGVHAVGATALGAFAGALISFQLGRQFTYRVVDRAVAAQAWRHGLVSLAGLGLNTSGEYFFHVALGIEYFLARVITSVIVSNAWNYPMQRYFVFARAARHTAVNVGTS